MTRNAIIELVKVKLDEITPDEVTPHPAEIYIDPSLDEAAKAVLRLCDPLKLRHDTLAITEATQVDGAVTFSIPDEVVRPLTVKLPSWSRRVTEFAVQGDVTDAQQSDPYTKGTVGRPVVVFAQLPTSRQLTCYSHPSITDLSTIGVTCIKYKNAEEIQDDLLEAIVYQTAYLVCISIGRVDAAKLFAEEFKKAL